MKKLMVALVLIFVLATSTVVYAFNGGGDCVVKTVDNKGNVTCQYQDVPNLPEDQVGGYSLNQVIGMTMVPNKSGGMDVRFIETNKEVLGSMNTETGEVFGFYSVLRAGGDQVYFPKDRCTTQKDGAKTFTSCVTTKPLEALPRKTGGYTLSEVIGLQLTPNDTGGVDSVSIKPGLGIRGSLYGSGEVSGFYMVKTPVGENAWLVTYYPLGER